MLVRKGLAGYAVAVLLCVALAVPAVALPEQAKAAHKVLPQYFTGEVAWDHVYYLSEGIGPRVAGGSNEALAAAYVKKEFEALGLEVHIQPFSYVRQGVTGNSQNVVAVKPGRGPVTLIVGAHYDSVARGKGAGDNASGVGVMLEAASLLKDFPTYATIKFIAWGAEEVGLRGSRHYVEQMSEEEIASTVAYINMDMVGIGDYCYVYAGLEGETWVRDMALAIGTRQGLDIRTTPDTSWGGFTGDWSDHVAFRLAGIPVAYFEWWNWHLDPYDMWGIETEKFGDILHTDLDTIAMVKLEKLKITGKIVTPLIYELAKTPLANTKSQGVGKRTARYGSV
ncbi:MAG: M20/M25/M40 family metallo-hydrolase [Bacillota bacterium]